MSTTDIVDFCTSFNENFPEGKGKELKGRWQMSEQRKFPLVYQLDRINVANGRVNVYTGDSVDDGVDIDKLNALHACNRCEVESCDCRGYAYNLGCEPGIDCLATK